MGESCYYLIRNGAQFDSQVVACNQSGGYLVKIDSQTEESMLSSYIAGEVHSAKKETQPE